MGNQPVDPKSSYSYEFTIGGKKYTGNLHDTALVVGDSVEVQYNSNHPGINRPCNPED